MAKAKKPTKKKDEAEVATAPPKTTEPLDPKKAHELFGLPGPYEPPPAPIGTKGYVTFWDSGCSIQTLAKKQPKLFCHPEWLDGERFAKDSDAWKWRELDLTPIGLNEPYTPTNGKEPPAARELVSYLILHFLVTGEKLDIPRLRCKDVLESGRRVIVGPFGDFGLEIANVSDRWASPGIATCSLFTPLVKKK